MRKMKRFATPWWSKLKAICSSPVSLTDLSMCCHILLSEDCLSQDETVIQKVKLEERTLFSTRRNTKCSERLICLPRLEYYTKCTINMYNT